MGNKNLEHYFSKNQFQKTCERQVFLLNKDSPFSVQEAYKTMRTNLQFVLSPNDNKCIAIVSARMAEGKSTTAANLAITMAQTDAKTLLIDADLRKPVLHKRFDLTNKNGLSTILGGFCDIKDGIHSQVCPNLDIITSGSVPPNPSELLGSSTMEQLVLIMRNTYDYVLIDTPPINVVSDALIVSQYCAGIMLVVHHRKTRHDDLRHAISTAEFANTKILGMVLTQVQPEQGGYYKYGKYSRYDYSSKTEVCYKK